MDWAKVGILSAAGIMGLVTIITGARWGLYLARQRVDRHDRSQPPTGIKVVAHNSDFERDLEPHFVGRVNGIRMWKIFLEDDVAGLIHLRVATLQIGEMPQRTGIQVMVREDVAFID